MEYSSSSRTQIVNHTSFKQSWQAGGRCAGSAGWGVRCCAFRRLYVPVCDSVVTSLPWMMSQTLILSLSRVSFGELSFHHLHTLLLSTYFFVSWSSRVLVYVRVCAALHVLLHPPLPSWQLQRSLSTRLSPCLGILPTHNSNKKRVKERLVLCCSQLQQLSVRDFTKTKLKGSVI